MFRVWIILIGLTLLAALLRFVNLSPFTVYPDSFQNLLVAENLRTYGEVVGYLGKDGLLFPESFSWSRPLYPLLINAVSYFGISDFISAKIIAYLLGVLAVPAAFLFVKTVFATVIARPRSGEAISNQTRSPHFARDDINPNTAGLIGAGLLALSYNHTVWSGMIMTESTGIFFMLLFLWRFFASIREQKIFSSQTILTGLLFCLAVLERYEYIIVAIPIILLTLQLSPKPYRYLAAFFGSFLFGILVTGFLIFPVNSIIPVVLSQLSDILIKIAIFLGVLLIIYSLFFFSKLVIARNKVTKQSPISLPRFARKDINIYIAFCIVLFFTYLLLQIIFGSFVGLFYTDFAFIRQFMKHDILLSVTAFFGILLVLRQEKYLAYFVLLTTFILGFIYHQTNPDMERYMTHLIPFFLIPASYSVYFVIARNKVTKQSQTSLPRFARKDIMKFILVILILFQAIITAWGLRNLHDPSWLQPSYEEVAAKMTGRYVQGNPILLVSFPEPYYYFTQKDTQSIADAPPFVYLPSNLDNRTILIVEDMGMHDVFPNFTNFLHKKLSHYKVASFYTHEAYHYTNQTTPENSPVILYKIKLGELKKKIH